MLQLAVFYLISTLPYVGRDGYRITLPEHNGSCSSLLVRRFKSLPYFTPESSPDDVNLGAVDRIVLSSIIVHQNCHPTWATFSASRGDLTDNNSNNLNKPLRQLVLTSCSALISGNNTIRLRSYRHARQGTERVSSFHGLVPALASGEAGSGSTWCCVLLETKAPY